MDREEAISHIEALYPIDSDYPQTAEIGEKLLAQAKRETQCWRNLPEATLVRYAQLCIEMERQ